MPGPVKYESAPIPFITLGNRRCLTDRQLCEDAELAAFVTRFRQCFEYDIAARVYRWVESL